MVSVADKGAPSPLTDHDEQVEGSSGQKDADYIGDLSRVTTGFSSFWGLNRLAVCKWP